MKDWNKIALNYHNLSHKGDEYSLLLGEPCSKADIMACFSSQNFSPPEEFIDVYTAFDGLGISSSVYGNLWMLVPLSQFSRCQRDARNWFSDDYPDLAQRFFPFIDWSNGDYSGYLLSSEGVLLPGIYDFSHEEYEPSDKIDENEVLESVYDSIYEFLTPDSM